ncbi:PsbP domain-containing protein 2 [Hibiscus syriacus]|uniref:PsbP domain-containing protein 2 n=1 Tax=Hibiscus syriacus TaxID=106335 RepID=A0A6A2XVF8_HIBSY|nr:psbP domain-containing protein 2, chloroplastic-like [Hibiscus syriacus]KAE8673940.1 PsbP domain-containing protein 2 [Hibiscus syriacus]
MASQICLLPHYNHCHRSSPKFPSSIPKALEHHFNGSNKIPSKDTLPSPLTLTKRSLNSSALSLVFIGFSPRNAKALPAKDLELERYVDYEQGFTLLRPSSWIKVEKAGATVLFEEANVGGNNVGVVVNPVRLNRLGEFGTPQFVADKLIQAEKRKESTKDAEVIGVAERPGRGGLQVYEFEYKVDSTRGGMKRILSAAFVASKKLYLLNIAHSDKPESPLDAHTRAVLEEILRSFDVARST